MVGEDTVSGLVFADAFVGISETTKDCRNKYLVEETP